MTLHDRCSVANVWVIHCQIVRLGHEPPVQCGIPQAQGTGATVHLARLTHAPSKQSSSMISFTCRGSGPRCSMTTSLASVGPAPIICSLVSQRFRRDFRTASTSDLGPSSKMSAPCTTPTHFPRGDLKEYFDIFPITIPAALVPFLYFTLPPPCSQSRPVQATPPSSCPGVEVVVVRQFNERLWERLCMEVCTPEVIDCHNLIHVPSSRRSVTEYTLHQL